MGTLASCGHLARAPGARSPPLARRDEAVRGCARASTERGEAIQHGCSAPRMPPGCICGPQELVAAPPAQGGTQRHTQGSSDRNRRWRRHQGANDSHANRLDVLDQVGSHCRALASSVKTPKSAVPLPVMRATTAPASASERLTAPSLGSARRPRAGSRFPERRRDHAILPRAHLPGRSAVPAEPPWPRAAGRRWRSTSARREPPGGRATGGVEGEQGGGPPYPTQGTDAPPARKKGTSDPIAPPSSSSSGRSSGSP